MSRRPYYRHFSEGLPISQGQIIKFQQKQAGNTHAYLLKALAPHIAKATPNFAMFEVLNPTTYVTTTANAASANFRLLQGDKVLLKDTNEEIENTDSIQFWYNSQTDKDLFSSTKATMTFETGANPVKEYYLFNRYQDKWANIAFPTLYRGYEYGIEFLNVPEDFSGFIKVVNATPFENLRADYPTIDFSSVEVEMTFPAGVTVSATYDTGSSYLNDPADGDYFYIEYSRVSAGNLILTKHPINTVPNGI